MSCFLQPFVAPEPTFLRPVAGIKFEMSSFSELKCKMYLFKHCLCSIVNKILAHVIWNYFSFHFIQILENVPTILEFRL